jgi:hypothetical protein
MFFDGQNCIFATLLTDFWPAARKRPLQTSFAPFLMPFDVLFVDFPQVCLRFFYLIRKLTKG